MYIQKTPEICEFLGLAKPPPTTATTTTTTTTTTSSSSSSNQQTTESNKNPNTNGDDNKHPAERTGSIGSKFAIVVEC